MEILFICNLIAGLLIAIFSFVFCYFDIKYRHVPVILFNGIFSILFIWFGLEYALLMMTDSLTYGIIVGTALGLPFLVWYFGKGKFGAVDARWISLIMLLIPLLYYQLTFIIVLYATTLIIVFISKYITKSYDQLDTNGEQKYAPEMVAILSAYIITLCLIGLFYLL